MLKLKATIEGETTGDLELALEEVTKLVSGEYTSGRDGNDTGSFSFEIEGEPVTPAAD